MIELLVELIGNPPAGLEFLPYLFSFLLVILGLYFLYAILRLFVNGLLHL